MPKRIGVVSQTTQVPPDYNRFIKRLVDKGFGQDAELWCADTICHDIRKRQAAALALAGRVDLMLVVGDRHSANARHLATLCGRVTTTRQITDAAEIEPSWYREGVRRLGIVGGASTPEAALQAVANACVIPPESDREAGDGTGDTLDGVNAPGHGITNFLEVRTLNSGDDVIGPGDMVSRGDAGDISDNLLDLS